MSFLKASQVHLTSLTGLLRGRCLEWFKSRP
jgi:hypothetical protein